MRWRGRIGRCSRRVLRTPRCLIRGRQRSEREWRQRHAGHDGYMDGCASAVSATVVRGLAIAGLAALAFGRTGACCAGGRGRGAARPRGVAATGLRRDPAVIGARAAGCLRLRDSRRRCGRCVEHVGKRARGSGRRGRVGPARQRGGRGDGACVGGDARHGRPFECAPRSSLHVQATGHAANAKNSCRIKGLGQRRCAHDGTFPAALAGSPAGSAGMRRIAPLAPRPIIK